MTDEEKSEQYAQNEINKMFVDESEEVYVRASTLKQIIKNSHLKGLAEGRKDGYEQGKNNERELQCGKKNYEKDISKLEKENAELKKDNTELEDIRAQQVRIINNDTVRIERLKKEIAELKTQIKLLTEKSVFWEEQTKLKEAQIEEYDRLNMFDIARTDELKQQIEELQLIIKKLVNAFNNYECAGSEQEQENTWEILRDLMHEQLGKI